MKRLLPSALLVLFAACSGTDSGTTTPTGDTTTPSAEDTTNSEAEAGTETEPSAETETGPIATDVQNVQVLPNTWNEERVTSYMKQVTTGLGVQCDYCHVDDDLASDDLETKLAARKMIKMSRELDAKYLAGDGKLTCYTCHKGKTHPED